MAVAKACMTEGVSWNTICIQESVVHHICDSNVDSKMLYRVAHLGSDSHGLKNGTRNGTKVQFEKEICTNYFFLIFLL